jgi:hypothetical protein
MDYNFPQPTKQERTRLQAAWDAAKALPDDLPNKKAILKNAYDEMLAYNARLKAVKQMSAQKATPSSHEADQGIFSPSIPI